MKTETLSWDWKGQIDIDDLNRALKAAGFLGSVNAVANTDNDQNIIIVSSEEIDDDIAQEIYYREQFKMIDDDEEY